MNGYGWLAMRLKALGHPVRLQILEVLEVEGEACVCHLESRLGQRQATISQHLARLRDAGLVADRRDGLNVFYSLADDSVASLLEEGRRGMPKGVMSAKWTARVRCPCPRCAEKVELSASAPGRSSQKGWR
jgi:ArsR family transcriptional regulator